METFSEQKKVAKVAKVANIFYCEKCNYECSRKFN